MLLVVPASSRIDFRLPCSRPPPASECKPDSAVPVGEGGLISGSRFCLRPLLSRLPTSLNLAPGSIFGLPASSQSSPYSSRRRGSCLWLRPWEIPALRSGFSLGRSRLCSVVPPRKLVRTSREAPGFMPLPSVFVSRLDLGHLASLLSLSARPRPIGYSARPFCSASASFTRKQERERRDRRLSLNQASRVSPATFALSSHSSPKWPVLAAKSEMGEGGRRRQHREINMSTRLGFATFSFFLPSQAPN